MQIPDSFQHLFWSANIHSLDTETDQIYIINQALAYGGIEELSWLLKTYPIDKIKEVFLHSPIKTYRPAAFNFIKDIILNITEPLPTDRYVINTPRSLG